ncbi:MAG: aldo/keto reductase [Chloroflexi bacterium]|nr:aldo/keto reductase [Chloroflexota bacterium]
MNYRRFGKLDWHASALGFGCMRLPIKNGDSANIDEPEATRMVRYAIDRGVNYIDTAYPYHGGNSELFVGRVLKDGYREKVRLATKLPVWKVQSADDLDPILNEQLQKLQTDHIDFYLLHGLNRERWDKLRGMDTLKWAARALADGRIRHLGFSFHDKLPVFQEIVDAYDWTFCQIQYNFMDIENQAGTQGLKYAAAKSMAVVVMEPLLGGKLVDPPAPVQDIWDTAVAKRAPADWALQWLWNQPEVSVVLSGMNTMEQVVQNIASASASRVNSFAAPELALFDQVRAKYGELSPIPCTKCEYCLPCPNGVAIPRVFAAYNEGMMYDKPDAMRGWYKQWVPAENQASACLQCLDCENKCPQNIPISQWLPIVHEVLAEGKPYVKRLN